jgi:hypothetical protein
VDVVLREFKGMANILFCAYTTDVKLFEWAFSVQLVGILVFITPTLLWLRET